VAAPNVFWCLEPLWRPSSRPLEANLLTIARDFSFFFLGFPSYFVFALASHFAQLLWAAGWGGGIGVFLGCTWWHLVVRGVGR